MNTQSKAVRQNCGIIFQNPSLDLHLTAEENVRFHAVLYGLYPFRPSFGGMPQAYQDHVKRLATVVGLEDEIHKPVKRFSGGMNFLATYTWSRCRSDGGDLLNGNSIGSYRAINVPGAGIKFDYGDCDFDIRHVVDEEGRREEGKSIHGALAQLDTSRTQQETIRTHFDNLEIRFYSRR